MDKTELEKLTKEGYSIRQLQKLYNKSNGSIRYWLSKYNLKTIFKQKTIWSKENILKATINAKSKADILKNLNLSVRAGNYDTLRKYSNIFNIELPIYQFNKGNSFKRSLLNNEIFLQNSTTSRNTVKRRLIEMGYGEFCNMCNINKNWHGKTLVFVLDHINGINNDNNIENLRFLCPNCNSTLETHCGKNIKYKKIVKEKNLNPKKFRKLENRPSLEKLISDIEKLGYLQTGKKYGVSDNAIRKWFKYYNQDYKNYKKLKIK